jgi:Ca-activated chloride channel family protein
MTWDRPIYLILLIFTPLMAFIILFAERRRRIALEKVIRADKVINISSRRYVLKILLLTLGTVFLLTALAGPRFGNVWQKLKGTSKDVVLLIDNSVSMLAGDIQPSRMEAAKEKVRFIIENTDSVRFGLAFFAGTAFVHCPVTFDKQALKLFLDEAWDNLIPLPGSNIEKALKVAADAFPPAKEMPYRYILLVTDGEELQGDATKISDELKKQNLKVVSLGLGTEEGEPIPVYQNGALSGYKKDKKGETVISKLNESKLKEISKQTGGLYVKGLNSISDAGRIIDFITKSGAYKMEEQVALGSEHRYQIPLFLAIIIFLFEFIISGRMRKYNKR